MHLPVNAAPSKALLFWLTYESELIAALRRLGVDVSLEVLKQQWIKPSIWDQQVLSIKNELVFHREICVKAKQKVCWYGHTMIPKNTYDSDPLLFECLKHESLGKIIFNTAYIKRTKLTHYAIDRTSLEYHWLASWFDDLPSLLWLRFSEWHVLEKYPFYLVEILFPELEHYKA